MAKRAQLRRTDAASEGEGAKQQLRNVGAHSAAPAILLDCGMNLAFNRPQIGAAIMHGLMWDGQSWARYDDIFAGWTSKACADHLRVGVKSGMPYI